MTFFLASKAGVASAFNTIFLGWLNFFSFDWQMKEFMVVKILWIQNKSKTGGMVHQMFSLVMQQGLSECIV